MKLRLDEYYYIISDEFDEIDEIEDYMPQYMVEELNKFREFHTPEEAFDYLENLYSHIEIIDTQYRTNYIDLEKSYINYTAIIKIEDKYYSFDWYYTWNWDFEDQVDANADLTEVFPKEVTVTEYESK